MGRESLKRLLLHPATAWIILFVSFILTGIAWYLSDSFMRQRAQDRFDFRTSDIQVSIERRMLEYESTLRGGLGLFEATGEVTRSQWRRYVAALQLERQFPGIQGYGYTQVVHPVDKARHEAQIRAEGFPDYSIRPPGERDLYTAIIYLEPFDARNQRAFGFDMYSEPTRRAAMELARDSGQPALSGRVKLVQETAADVQHGVLLYLPVYRHGMPQGGPRERSAALQGFVYAPFRMRDLMQGILGADQGDVDFALYDGTALSDATLLYETVKDARDAAALRPEFSGQKQIQVAGRPWTLIVHAKPGFLSRGEESQPLVVAVGGLLVDLLLFVIIGSIARRQKQAEQLAEAMTDDLRRSNTDLEQFAYAASHDMRQPLRMVTSYLQLIEEELGSALDSQKRQFFGYAIDGARRMDEMLVALLEYSRVGHDHARTANLDSRSLLDEALHILAPAIREAGAKIEITGSWPVVHGAHDELVRLMQNLIGNAVKYRRPDGRPEILVNATSSADELRLTIRDNGVGLPPGQEKRLFKVFERLHARGMFPGTGIGLALCRKIVEHHGGRIWAESPGEDLGCTFHVALPAAVSENSPSQDRQDRQP